MTRKGQNRKLPIANRTYRLAPKAEIRDRTQLCVSQARPHALRPGRFGRRDRKRKPRVSPLRRVLDAELPISFQPNVSLHLTHGEPKPKLRPDAEDTRSETTDRIPRPAIAANLLINITGNSSRNLL